MPLDKPFQFSPSVKETSFAGQRSIKILQYNQNITNNDLAEVKELLQNNGRAFDVAIVQEASEQTVLLAKQLTEIYPYQRHKPSQNAFGMVLLSRYPIIREDIIPLKGPVLTNMLMRIVIKPPMLSEPINIYALHAMPPIGHKRSMQRNFELNKTAHIISKDMSQYKILMGDWNITPYSPYFKELLTRSGLKLSAFGMLQNATWPAFNTYSAFKIPIDHALYSDAFVFLNKQSLSSAGSDHNALVITLGLP